MKFIYNIISMPIILKLIFFVGFFSPAIVVASILSGSITPGYLDDSKFGSASVVEFLAAVVCVVPVFASSVMMLKKLYTSIYIYIIGWFIISFSPLLLSTVREEFDIFVFDLLFSLALGVGLAIYLLSSKEVKKYFNHYAEDPEDH